MPAPSIRRALIALAALGAILVVPNVAPAADYCVATSGCAAADTYPATDLQTVLDIASKSLVADRVTVGPGHYGQSIYLGPSALEVAGAGSGRTVFDVPAGKLGLLLGGVGSSVHDASFELTGSPSYGIVTAGSIADVDIAGAAGVPGAIGVILDGGASVARATVALPGGGTGMRIDDTATVVDSTIDVGSDGPTSIGVLVQGSTLPTPVSLKRLRIKAANPLQTTMGQVRIADSLLDLGPAPFGIGILAQTGVNGPAAMVAADRVSIIGHGDVAELQTGVESSSTGSGATVGVTIENSVIANTAYAFSRTASDGYAYLGVHHSLYTPGAFVRDMNSGPGTGALEQDGVKAADPGFVDPAGGDYRPAAGSPLIDASEPAFIALGPTDLAGATRLVDGNGDGSALADLGAFEYQRQAPAVDAATATPVAPIAGQPVTFSGSATDADPGEQPAGSWTFGDGSSAGGGKTVHAYAAPGSYIATFTVTDPSGLKASRTVTITVSPAAPLTSVATKQKGSTLTLSGLHATPSRFRLARFLPGKAARKAKGGTAIKLSVSSSATLTLVLLDKHNKVAGVLRVAAHAGPNTIRFGGRLTHTKTLRPGSYRLQISAPSAKTVGIRLTVLR